jgi:hypothetical protein
MLNITAIREKALRRYPEVLSSSLQNIAFTPLVFPVGKYPDDFNALRAWSAELIAHEKSGYEVVFDSQKSRKWGTQNVPVQVVIPTLTHFLRLVEKTAEFETFEADVALIRHAVPTLETWMVENPMRVIAHHGKWAQLIEVCCFFQDHQQSDVGLRELPVRVHTKFIETHTRILRELLDLVLPPYLIDTTQSDFFARYAFRREAPPVRFRLLDDQFQARYQVSFTDITLPVHEMNAVDFSDQRILIVENKATFLSMPKLPNTIVVFGQGFAVEVLANITWIQRASIYYWGDLDAQGFQILALLRFKLPNTSITSVMMDDSTLKHFSEFVVMGTPTTYSPLVTLTSSEQAVHQFLAETNTRLEQERVSLAYALEKLHAVFTQAN